MSRDGFLPLQGVKPSVDVRDNVRKPCCCVCGKIVYQKNYQVWVCVKCRNEFGLPHSLKDWPEWARFLMNSEQKRRWDLGIKT